MLQKTNVELLDMELCNSSYSYDGEMKAGMLCAGRLFEGELRFRKSFQNLNTSILMINENKTDDRHLKVAMIHVRYDISFILCRMPRSQQNQFELLYFNVGRFWWSFNLW